MTERKIIRSCFSDKSNGKRVWKVEMEKKKQNDENIRRDNKMINRKNEKKCFSFHFRLRND